VKLLDLRIFLIEDPVNSGFPGQFFGNSENFLVFLATLEFLDFL
jgi:hypothetical protein